MCFMDQNNVILLYVGSASLLLLSWLWWHGKGDTCNVYIKYTFQLEWSASVYVSLCLCCVGTVSKVNNDEEQEISFFVLLHSTRDKISPLFSVCVPPNDGPRLVLGCDKQMGLHDIGSALLLLLSVLFAIPALSSSRVNIHHRR